MENKLFPKITGLYQDDLKENSNRYGQIQTQSQNGKFRKTAQRKYQSFVKIGISKKISPWENLKGEIFLGKNLSAP